MYLTAISTIVNACSALVEERERVKSRQFPDSGKFPGVPPVLAIGNFREGLAKIEWRV